MLPTAVAYWKYRAIPGYHTWSVKLGSVAMGASAPLLLLFDVAWPFRVAALFQVLCALDELRITWLFAECRHDVPSVFPALRIRRAPRSAVLAQLSGSRTSRPGKRWKSVSRV